MSESLDLYLNGHAFGTTVKESIEKLTPHITSHQVPYSNNTPDYLVFGSTGYIGTRLCQILTMRNKAFVCSTSRIEKIGDVHAELDTIKPKYVIDAAGLTGRPNIDWCEDNKLDTIRVNVLGTLALADACYTRNIHLTYFGTGCIYDYDEKSEHCCGGKAYTEEDIPNYTGSFYSMTKAQVEYMIKQYSNVLTLRIRMPITGDLHPRNFITKIISYKRIVNYPNSLTVLPILLPVAIDMTERGITGVYNFTNPGTISHNEVIELYKKYINPDKEIENFTLEEQSKVLTSGRCNCHLDVSKLLGIYPEIPDINMSMIKIFELMRRNKGI